MVISSQSQMIPLVNERLHNELEYHHAINGKTHYSYGHGFNSFLYVYQAG